MWDYVTTVLNLFKFILKFPNPRESSTNIQESHLESQQILKKISINQSCQFKMLAVGTLADSLRILLNTLIQFTQWWRHTAKSKTCRASAMPCLNGKLPVHPLPTWKLTPMTSKPSSPASFSSLPTDPSLAPNFELSFTSDLESSTAMRRTSL